MEQICSKTGALREVMHIFYICGICIGIFIKTKPQVLSEAMGNSCCQQLPHSGERGKISSQDSRVCMEICIHTIKHSEEKKHSLYSGDSQCTFSKAWF